MKNQGEKKSVSKNEDRNDPVDQQDENLPGYPHYPVSEDIMNTAEKKISIDIENPEAPLILEDTIPAEPNDDLLQEGTSADVTREDIRNLGEEGLAMDMGDDEDLKQRGFPVDMEGKDLVVPGSELDDKQEEIGSEDEENNFYSNADN